VTDKAHLNGSEKTESQVQPETLPKGDKTTNYLAISTTWVEHADGSREARYHMVTIDPASHRTRSILLGIADDACQHEMCGVLMAVDLFAEYMTADSQGAVHSDGRHYQPAVQTTIE
jgi:hypothetical protein